jgi:putative membrane protein
MARIPALLTAALVACACGPGGSAEPPPDRLPPSGSVASEPAPLTDAQIADVLVVSSQVDSAAGALAQASGSDVRVREFGARIAADHAGARRAAAELAGRLGLAPGPNPVSTRFREDGIRNRAVLERESGAEFDRLFVENEVEYHEGMLETLDGTLLPSARGAELQAHLEQVRPVVEAHLQQARALLGALPGGG